jgi:hypothetical protein
MSDIAFLEGLRFKRIKARESETDAPWMIDQRVAQEAACARQHDVGGRPAWRTATVVAGTAAAVALLVASVLSAKLPVLPVNAPAHATDASDMESGR